MSNLNMPVKYCTDENDEEFSPVVYQESMFNDDGTRMDPVPRKMFAKAYDPTKTYPTENLFCIQDNKYYKFTGSGTTTGTFDPTKWTETDDATELTTLNSTLTALGEVVRSPSNTTHTSIPSGDTAGTECATITLQPGIWVLVGKICWAPNANGYRQVSFQSVKNGARETSNVTVGVANKEITHEVIYISSIATETTFKLYGMQTSGSSLDAYPHLSAYKIKNV